MNILFLSSNYYPEHNANSQCLANIAEELALSHDVSVISLSKKCHKEFVHNNVNVISVTTEYASKIENINSDKDSNNFFLKIKLLYIKLNYWLKNIFSRITCDKDKKNSFKSGIYNYIKPTPDIIIPVCFPIESVIAAVEFKQENSNVIILPYLLDKYSTSQTAHRFSLNKKIKFGAHLSIEKLIINESNNVFVYDSWLNHIKEYFPESMSKILHVEHPLIKKTDRNIKGYKKNNILYAGALSRKIRSPIIAFNIIVALLEQIDSLSFDLYSLGDCQDIAHKYSKDNCNFNSHGHVSSDSIQVELESAKYLLLIGNSDIMQLQSKVFEYMSTGKPIIFVGKDKQDPITSILKKYKNCCIVFEEEPMIESICKLREFILDSNYKIVDFEQVYNDFYKCTPEFIANEFEKIFKANFNK